MFHNKKKHSTPQLLFGFVFFTLGGLCLIIFALLTLLFYTSIKRTATDSDYNHAFYNAAYKKNAQIAELAYVTLQHLYTIHNSTKEYEKFEIRVLKHIQKYQHDPNNGYYFLLLGTIAEKRNAQEQALIQYIKASQHPPSPAYLYLAKRNSIKESLNNIVRLELEPRRSLYYISLLLQHNQEAQTETALYYKIGKNYEKLGLWDLSYKSYNTFLQYQKKKNIREKQDNEKIQEIYFRLARRKESMKGRIWNNPQKARNTISHIMLRGSASQLMRMRTPAFFIAQWDDDILRNNIYVPKFGVQAVFKRSNIYMEPVFNPHSTYTKKFWRITGWDRVSEWFFVFQKIYQPDIPSINGSWEWAGIYLGSKNARTSENL